MRNHITPFSYNTQSKEIAFFDENVPFQKFKVEVALMSDSIMGSIYNDTTTHGMCFFVQAFQYADFLL